MPSQSYYEILISMIHTSEQAIQAAREILEKKKIKHTAIGKPNAKTDHSYNKDTPNTDFWVVSYTYMVFEEEMAFIYLDDRNGLNLLYILTKHGYLK